MLDLNIRGRWGNLLAVLTLSVATFLSLSYIDRFYPEIDQMLTDSVFVDGIMHWQEDGSGTASFSDNLVSINNSVSGYHSVFQSVPISEAGYYRVTFDALATNVVADPDHKGAGAGVLLRYDKADGIKKTGTAFLVPGDIGHMKTYRFDVHVRNDVTDVDLMLRLLRTSGQLEVANIALSKLQETGTYKFLKVLVVLIWLAAGLGLLVIAMRSLPLWQVLFVAILCGVALVGALVPETVLQLVSKKISGVLPLPGPNAQSVGHSGVPQASQTGTSSFFSDIGHLGVFTALGLFAGLFFQRFGLGFIATSLAVFAIITEVLQLLVARRTPSLDDLILDGLGVLLGLLVGIGCCLAMKRSVIKKSDD